MNEENKTELPHDQVANDNDGEQRLEDHELGALDNPYRAGQVTDGGVTPLADAAFEDDIPDPDPNRREPAPYGTGAGEDRRGDEGVDTQSEGSDEEHPYLSERREDHVDDLNRFEEEAATEITPIVRQEGNRDNKQVQHTEEMQAQEEGSATLGWTALILSIVSLFFLPVLTASVGIVTGFFAYRSGTRTLGIWAIAIGIFSIVISLFLVPFVR